MKKKIKMTCILKSGQVVEVRQYKGLNFGLFYYTEAGYEQFKEIN